MLHQAIPIPLETTVSAANGGPAQAARLRQHGCHAFTLAELLVSMGVLVLLVLLFTQVLNSAATITTSGHKQMDADSQARQLLDRMAVDFTQMIKRSDVNYYWKGGGGGNQPVNDQMGFYCAVPSYYSTTTATTQSPMSLIAYRINAQNQAERMGKGLLWNGVSPDEAPLIFWQGIAAPSDTDFTTWGEIIGPQVFRFEYCYLRTDGTLSITPPAISAMAAIIVDIAVIDPKSKVLVNNAQVSQLAARLDDYSSNMFPGQLRTQWQNKLNGIIDPSSPDYDPSFPRSAVSGVRLYERFFYLSPPTL